MKAIKNRVSKLENKNPDTGITGFSIVIVDTKEQVDHPERFNKVLASEEVKESGFTRKVYELERKDPQTPI